jgi:transposase
VNGTMTWAAMDVHARSIYAASMDVITGEVSRQRFDTGAVEPVVSWLAGLPEPVRCCYEAGPTGFGLYRAAVAAGVECQVIAPSKTPRASGERHKSDRRDTDLLLRQLMAGALTPVAVPSPTCEAARDLARAREQVRIDLMRCRHRLSKLLLRHGRVWDRSAWTKAHREWLGSQTFAHQNTELAFIDNLAACDGLVTRKQALDERLSHVATDPEFWPLVSRLRAFRGIDTLSALILVLEVSDFTRFPRAVQLGSWLGLVPSREQSGETDRHGRSPRPARSTRGGSS